MFGEWDFCYNSQPDCTLFSLRLFTADRINIAIPVSHKRNSEASHDGSCRHFFCNTGQRGSQLHKVGSVHRKQIAFSVSMTVRLESLSESLRRIVRFPSGLAEMKTRDQKHHCWGRTASTESLREYYHYSGRVRSLRSEMTRN